MQPADHQGQQLTCKYERVSPESEPTTSSGIPDKHEASENVVEDYSESNTVVSSKEQETSLYTTSVEED